jgi:hypothetical protein
MERGDQAGKPSCSSAWRPLPEFAKEDSTNERSSASTRPARALVESGLSDLVQLMASVELRCVSERTAMARKRNSGRALFFLLASGAVLFLFYLLNWALGRICSLCF